MPRIAPDAVRHQVLHRLSALRLLPYATLAALPEWRTEAVPFGPHVATVTTYRDAGPDGALEIVVQCMPEGHRTGVIWRGVFADGFWLWPDGRMQPLPDPHRFYYM